MGAEVHCESYLPGLHSMGNLNEDSSSGCWPFFFGDKAMTNGHYYNGFVQRASVDNGYRGQEKDALKRKMLEHDAVFKNQVSELHRLYRVQRDMMDEVKRREPQKQQASMEPALSSSIQGSRLPLNDTGKWHMAGFSLLNSGCDRTPVSEVKFVYSPSSYTKGNDSHLGQLLFPNGSASKDFEALNSRPFKVRKKLFDLHLPAEEYIDTKGERLQEDKRIDASSSASCLRGSIGLADLNDPVQTEEATAPSCVDSFGHSSESEETKRTNEPRKSNSGYFGTAGETLHVHDGFLIRSAAKSRVNDRGCLSNVDYSGLSRNNLSSVPQGHQPVKSYIPTHPAKGILSPVHHPSETYGTGYVREDVWKAAPWHGFDSDGTRGHPDNSCLEPVAASQTNSSFPFFTCSSLASSWDNNNSHPGPDWAKPGNTVPQNATTLEACSNSAVVMSASLQPSAHSGGPFGGKWLGDANTRLNPLLRNESMTNGFYKACTSRPYSGLYGLNNGRVGNLASDHSTNHQLGNILSGSRQADSKLAPVINLNEDVSKTSSNEVVTLLDFTMSRKDKPEDCVTALPWLKPKPTNVNKLFNAKGALASSNSDVRRENETSETRTVKKFLGFPIFDNGVAKSDSLCLDACPEERNYSNERENGMTDINVACEPDDKTDVNEFTIIKERGPCVRDYIDLNISVSDCEDPPALSCYKRCASVKIALEIDLEAPAFPESEDDDTVSKESHPGDVPLALSEHKDEQVNGTVLQSAAETIVAISSSNPQICIDDNFCHTSVTCLEESLGWFVDTLSSYAIELEKICVKESRFKDGSPQQEFSNEIDDFEAMMLQLEQAKEEDYMPQPFFPEFEIEDEKGANTVPNRSRRGLSRRGRQRRDFQRDILPGLATLARHEVTEDIQTFGGLMRATGHSWNPGLTRRNGGSRGRRRAVVETVPTATSIPVCAPPVQQFISIEAGLEERSLTGWGKTTTRRPRRQRCPAGNNPQLAVVLT